MNTTLNVEYWFISFSDNYILQLLMLHDNTTLSKDAAADDNVALCFTSSLSGSCLLVAPDLWQLPSTS